MHSLYVNPEDEKALKLLFPVQDSLDSGELTTEEYVKQFVNNFEAIMKRYKIDLEDCCSTWIEHDNGRYYIGYEIC